MAAPSHLMGASRALLASRDLSNLLVTDFFRYQPSTALAATALALFAAAALVVGVQTARSGRHFLYLVTLTSLLEAGGYAGVLYCIAQSGRSNLFGAFVAKQLLLLVTPNILQAVEYLTVGHVLAASPGIARGRRLLSKKGVTILFTGADLFALFVQGGGMGIYATAATSTTHSAAQIKLGSIVVLVGLAAQLAFYAVFTALAIWVHRHPENGLLLRSRRRLFVGLYLNIVFLSIRNIYRFVEFAQTTVLGYPTPPGTYVLEHHEVPFNTLDTIPILCCFAAFIAFHPGWYLEPAAGGANGGDVDKCVALPQQQQPKAGGSGGKRCAVWADASGGGV